EHAPHSRAPLSLFPRLRPPPRPPPFPYTTLFRSNDDVVLFCEPPNLNSWATHEILVLDFFIERRLPLVFEYARHNPHYVIGQAWKYHLVVAPPETFHVLLDNLFVCCHCHNF